jgi:hypothetical protein
MVKIERRKGSLTARELAQITSSRPVVRKALKGRGSAETRDNPGPVPMRSAERGAERRLAELGHSSGREENSSDDERTRQERD